MQKGVDREDLAAQNLATGALDVTSAARARPASLARVVVKLSGASAQQFRVYITDGSLEYLIFDDTPAVGTADYVFIPDREFALMPGEKIRVRLANSGPPAVTATPYVYLEN